MPIRVGAESVSAEQRIYLVEARRAPVSVKARILRRVFDDLEIQSGEESLHPDWVEIYESNAGRLSRFLPSRYADLIRESLCTQRDEAISAIDPGSDKLAFLLGAGASKPEPSGIPTVRELLPDLLDRARRLDRPDLQKLADFCDETLVDNIEDLLTAAQLSEFCTRNPSVLRLVDFLIYRRESERDETRYRMSRTSSADLSGVAFLQDTLQMLFGLLSSRMLPAEPNPAHCAIATHTKANPAAAIVTTNYDCCMDLALLRAKATFSYLVEFGNQEGWTGYNSVEASLIKLHGSLNWYYCETCQQVHLIDIERTVEEYRRDEGCYSVVAVCKDCGGQRRGLLVPPLAMKFDLAPPLTPLIEKAQDCFTHADVLVVVGFSFAEADMYISRMLTKSMRRNPEFRAVVFDPDYGVAEKLRRQLSLRIDDFDQQRVIRAVGDCASLLPEFLEGRLRQNACEPADSASTEPEAGEGDEGQE